jgi:hypothetical protein
MVHVSNLDTKLEDYFRLSFIITKLDNVDAMLGGYFKLRFIIAEVGNLYTNYRVCNTLKFASLEIELK